MWFEPAAIVIGNITRETALEGWQARDVALAVIRHDAVDERERALPVRHPVEECAFGVHLDGGRRIAGEEGIATEVLRAHDAFEQRQVTLALQPQRQCGRLQADDLSDVGFPHGSAI